MTLTEIWWERPYSVLGVGTRPVSAEDLGVRCDAVAVAECAHTGTDGLDNARSVDSPDLTFLRSKLGQSPVLREA